jgi:hypothetical protein
MITLKVSEELAKVLLTGYRFGEVNIRSLGEGMCSIGMAKGDWECLKSRRQAKRDSDRDFSKKLSELLSEHEKICLLEAQELDQLIRQLGGSSSEDGNE